MSLIQKQKTEIELIVRKRVNGLEITAISENLKKVLDNINMGNLQYKNPILYKSIFFNEFNRQNDLISREQIPNLTVLKNFNEINHVLIYNVFTDKEIKLYIKLFKKLLREIVEIANIE